MEVEGRKGGERGRGQKERTGEEEEKGGEGKRGRGISWSGVGVRSVD